MLEKPNAAVQLFLKVRTFQWAGQNGTSVRGLPAKNTLLVDIGKRNRTFQIAGRITGQQGESVKGLRESLEDAWQNWYSVGDGRSRLKWGTMADGTDYDWKVSIKSTTLSWNSTSPGSSAKPIIDFTITLEEVGVIGALN